MARKNKNKRPSLLLPILVGLSSLALASIAAYISVTGLSKIFPVAASIFLFGALEISKLVTASLLHNHWKRLNKALKTYLTIAVVFLIVITSAGLYSFLSSAYSKTATKIEVAQKENSLDDLNKKNLEDKVVNYQDLINSKNKRIDILADQRSQQETRLDSLYARRAYNSAKRTETLIKDANSDISQLTSEVDSLNTLITTAQSGVYDLEIGKIDREVEQAESDVLTFIYISELTGLPIGKVINWLVILLVFIFDPLAVLLLVSFNSLLQHRREFDENEENIEFEEENIEFEEENSDIGVVPPKEEEVVTSDIRFQEEVPEEPIFDEPSPYEGELIFENTMKTEEKPEKEIKEDFEIYHADESGKFNPLDFLSPEEKERVLKAMQEKQEQQDKEKAEKEEAARLIIQEAEERRLAIIEKERHEKAMELVRIEEAKESERLKKEEEAKFRREEIERIQKEKEEIDKAILVEEERKENEEMQILSNLEENRGLFLHMIDVLYDNGNRTKGSSFEPYSMLKTSMKNAGVEIIDREYDDFLTVCALLRIIQVQTSGDDQNRKLLKDYKRAKVILSALGS